MGWFRPTAAALLLLVVSACGSEDADGDGSSTGTGPEVVEEGCKPGELARDGICIAAGVPADGCAPGFESDGEAGCRAILPAEPCPAGQMALPGELACRPVAPCSDEKYGEAPIGPDTVFVDAAYSGADSDGSVERPFKTLMDGLAGATEFGVIALAEGIYSVSDFTSGKPVRIWGRCPELVEIRGEPGHFGALALATGMDGSELHDLTIRSAAIGIGISGSRDILIERVWFEGVATNAVELQDVLGPPSVEIRNCLIEETKQVGVGLAGGEASIAGTVIRGRDDGLRSAGLVVGVHPQTDTSSKATVSNSFFERTSYDAIQVMGGELSMDGTLVRGTTPGYDGTLGRGLEVMQLADTTRRSSVTVRTSVFEDNHDVGIYVLGSDATIESTVVRNTRPSPVDSLGRGISIQGSPYSIERSQVTIRSSLVAGNHDQGIRVGSSDATIESTVVRDTQPGAGGHFGRGMVITADPTSFENSTAVVRGCTIERSFDVGLIVVSAHATIEDTLVRDTVPRAADGAFGDGIAVLSITEAATTSLTRCHVERSARAGVASFGAKISVASSTIDCSGFPLDGEGLSFAGTDYQFQFEDLGGNLCGCSGERDTCQVATASLAPPDALEH